MYMLLAKYYDSLLQQVRVDGTDLHIISYLPETLELLTKA
jgi:hypothetical protein